MSGGDPAPNEITSPLLEGQCVQSRDTGGQKINPNQSTKLTCIQLSRNCVSCPPDS